MGMKPPAGSAQKIGGTVSSPSDKTCFDGVGNAISKAKPTGNSNVGNSATPNPKPTPDSKIYKP